MGEVGYLGTLGHPRAFIKHKYFVSQKTVLHKPNYNRKHVQQKPILHIKLLANAHNNCQHCNANNVGSCWVHVGSGEQTDATTPNNVGTLSASWEGYNQGDHA